MGLFNKSETQSVALLVEGMTCPHCTAAVEEALKNIAAVKNVKADLKTKIVTVILKKPVETRVLIGAVETAGYDAYLFKKEDEIK